MTYRRWLLVLIPCTILAACGAAPAATTAPSPIPTAAAVAPSPTVAPTSAPSPTTMPTAEPSPTTMPTAEPSPSPMPTAAPSPTPVPTVVPSPTAAPAPAAASAPVRLVIPAIDLDRPLVSVGLDSQRVPIVPNHDVGWYNLSAGPGQGENIVLWGHVLRFKSAPTLPAPFARLKDLAVGAELTLYGDDGGARRYRVVRQVWATPDQVEYILPKGRELLTLVSCIGDKVVVDSGVELTNRLITIAEPAP